MINFVEGFENSNNTKILNQFVCLHKHSMQGPLQAWQLCFTTIFLYSCAVIVQEVMCIHVLDQMRSHNLFKDLSQYAGKGDRSVGCSQ